MQVDFSKAEGVEFFNDLEKHFKDKDVSMLINNVEFGDYGSFLDMKLKDARDMFVVNCVPVTLLTRKVVPYMLERKKKSAIINMSSQLSEVVLPNRALYCATKRYIDYLSRSLSEEFRGRFDILSYK